MAPALTLTAYPKLVLGTASFGNAAAPQARFTTIEAATQLLQIFRDRGYTEIDTARAYPVGANGTSEQLLGNTRVGEWAVVSTKVTSWVPGSHDKMNIAKSIDGSLEALAMNKVSIEYLHSPERTTPFEETCEAMDRGFREGKFERFGISNYTAKEVEEIVLICQKNGWVKPSVYQGPYNAIARLNEDELLPLLRKYGISFYAYSPSAAGFFSENMTRDAGTKKGSRWDLQSLLGQKYTGDYFKEELFKSAARVRQEAKRAGLTGHEVALRWVAYHSQLSYEHGDALVIGASSTDQLIQNLDIVEAGPLPDAVAKMVDGIWSTVKPVAPSYHM
ncbi:MAG: hypothetical protein FRX48_00754 [Lasallia pustulata]|uniref:NADP-dependent oxidoreductase domain-containing protein n=1 Tax=Lasallia pustulata TaxID=136370 RepID=A0A5M8Q496_9LECA|nr:MAG: hypothetical protein FRX48_00754 [Lasallia pustulata]